MKQASCRYLGVLPLAILLLLGWSAYLPTSGLATDLPVYGGLGGNEFRADCPKGWYLVGLAGRTGEWVDQIAPICAPWLRGSQTFGAPSIGPSFGTSGGGQERHESCLGFGINNRVVQSWRISVLRSDNHFVQYIRVHCTSLASPASTVNWTFGTIPDSEEEIIALGAFGSDPPNQACPQGEVAVGIRARAGRFVDAIGLVCGPLPAKLGAPVTKLPSPLVQAPSPAVPMNPQAKNMRVPDDMFVITKPAAGDRVQQGQLVVTATPPKVGMTQVTELELRCLDAPPNQLHSYPCVTVFSVDTPKLLQGYPVTQIVTGGYAGRWQVRARASMKTVPGPWSFPVQFQMVTPQPSPSMMQQAPLPSSSIMQAPTQGSSAASQMIRPPTTPSQGSGAFSGMIRPRGVEEKGGTEGNQTVDQETVKKP